MATFDVIWTETRPNMARPPVGSLYYFGSGASAFYLSNPRIGGPLSIILPSSWAESGLIQMGVDDVANTAQGYYTIQMFSIFPPLNIGTKVDVTVQQDIVIPEWGVNCRIRRGVVTEL